MSLDPKDVDQSKEAFVQIATMLPPSMIRRLDALATRQMLSRNSVIRQACISYLTKQEREEAA